MKFRKYKYKSPFPPETGAIYYAEWGLDSYNGGTKILVRTIMFDGFDFKCEVIKKFSQRDVYKIGDSVCLPPNWLKRPKYYE